MTKEIILEVGAEGAMLTLFGSKDASNAWKFWTETDETGIYELLDEEDRASLGSPVHKSEVVTTLSEGFELLGRSWFRLFPLQVHPEFRDVILFEVRKRGTPADEASWNERLERTNMYPAPEGRFKSMKTREQVHFREGMIVDMVSKPEWGPGKIVHIDDDHLHILFRDLEGNVAKTFILGAPALQVAPLQSDPILDNLPPLIQKDGHWYLPASRIRISFASAERKFLHFFPSGFSDPLYLTSERKEKDEAHRRFQELLGLEEIKHLLAIDDMESLKRATISVLGPASFLLSRFESAAFHDALHNLDAVRSTFSTLLRLLESPHTNAEVFEPYLEAVSSLPAERGPVATWPVATLLPYLAQPERHMFLKPEVTKTAAEVLGFDLQYNPTLNWLTYSALLRMGTAYLGLLKYRGAKDFVDVQSFVFVVCGGYD